jgi:hypothetical protein
MKHTKIEIKSAVAVQPFGVFAGKSNAEYHGDEAVSKSSTDIIRKSPMHYKHSRMAGLKSSTAAQLIGTLVHALVLEPETFWDCYARPFEEPEGAIDTVAQIKDRLKELGVKVASSAKKPDLIDQLRDADPTAIILEDARAKHAAEVGDKEIITVDDLAKAEAIRDSIMSHPVAGKLFAAGSGVPELSCYWRDPETGVECRCRPDWWRHDGLIVDLKTCLDASPEGFSKSIFGWRYHVQHAFYVDGIAAALEQSEVEIEMPAPRAFIFVAVEKTAPFAVGVYALDAESVEIGRRAYREDLATFARCRLVGNWPGYGDKIQSISLPEWVLRREAYENADEGEAV